MKKVTFEEMLESMSARLHLIEAENESLKMDAQESRAIANRAMLENTVSSNSLPYTKEPRVCLPDKVRWNSEKLSRVYQPARAGFPTAIRSVQHRPKDDRDSRYSFDRKRPGLAGKSILLRLCGFVPPTNSRSRLERLRPSSPILLWTQLRNQGRLGPLSTLLQLFLWQSSKQSKSTIDFMSVDSSGLRTSNTSWNQTPRRPPPPSPMVVPPPRSSNDMDIDFARRGPLTSEERQQRMSRGLCLVCGQSGL
ncbi:hypothetical protein BASA62_002990 [Batrachochytrium salamandrivorans]|nr:hypothetical protein BASA62_002990 [Batrachochytrium salamandrivorans]